MISGLIRDLLGVVPAVPLRPYYDTQLQADVAFARDPEGQAAAGLSALLMTVLHTCGKMNDRNTDRVRLMDENDARLAARPDLNKAFETHTVAAEDVRSALQDWMFWHVGRILFGSLATILAITALAGRSAADDEHAYARTTQSWTANRA